MLAQLYSAMRLPHCELGSRLFPRSLQPLNHQTRSPTTDEQACPPPEATWSSPPHQHYPEEACHLHPDAFCKQLLESHATSPFSQAILLTQSAPDTGAHLLSPNSEACEAEDRCLRVSNGQETHVTAPLQSQTPQALFWHGLNASAAGRSDLWQIGGRATASLLRLSIRRRRRSQACRSGQMPC